MGPCLSLPHSPLLRGRGTSRLLGSFERILFPFDGFIARLNLPGWTKDPISPIAKA